MHVLFHVTAAIAFATASLAASAAEPPAGYLRLYEALWSAVNESYYDPYFHGTDWAAQRERFRPRAARVRDDEGFLALANEMLGEIGSSHLYVTAPPRSTGRARIGARFATMGEDQIAIQVAPLSDAYRQGLRVGDRLMSDPEALRGELGTSATLQVRSCDDRPRSLAVRREGAFWPPEHPGFRWSQVRVAPERRIGYMRIDRFDDGAAELADRAMAELGDSQAIIIDVRDNSGGNVSALRLASYFGSGAEPSVILMSRPYLETLGRPASRKDILEAPRVRAAYTDEAVFAAMEQYGGRAAFWTDTVERPFRAPVFVLIGPETGSAAEGFAWQMRQHTHARLIGQRTAGALLSSESIELGEGWSVTIPVHGLWGPDGEDYGDRAVDPHEVVAPTREDLCAGRDPVLEAALRQASAP